MAFFEGLVFTEDGAEAPAVYVGADSFYVVDEQGFRRHVDAREVDRAVLSRFVEQIAEHREEAAEAMLRMMGQDDLFAKAMVDASLDNINVDEVVSHSLPADARQWLGMIGFRVIINVHGEVVRVEMPAATEDWDED
jgi:hypothetical protein